jgi:hypothetical protein
MPPGVAPLMVAGGMVVGLAGSLVSLARLKV